MKQNLPQPSLRHRERLGFTLLELLVCIVVLAVLAALAAGAFSTIRGKSTQARCAGNLKQLYIYFTTYSQDHDGYFPYVARYAQQGANQHWYYNSELLSLMQVPLGNVWGGKVPFYLCPIDNDGMSKTFDGVRALSYGVNIALGSGGSSGYTGTKYIRTRFSQIEYPSRLLMGCDASEYYLQVKSGAIAKAAYRHEGGTNVLFCDGHVVWMKGPLPTSVEDPQLWWPDGVAR